VGLERMQDSRSGVSEQPSEDVILPLAKQGCQNDPTKAATCVKGP
jgi:hypothetical protein